MKRQVREEPRETVTFIVPQWESACDGSNCPEIQVCFRFFDAFRKEFCLAPQQRRVFPPG
jgi:hypothetical protein